MRNYILYKCYSYIVCVSVIFGYEKFELKVYVKKIFGFWGTSDSICKLPTANKDYVN
jgi:hypothetical protein